MYFGLLFVVFSLAAAADSRFPGFVTPDQLQELSDQVQEQADHIQGIRDVMTGMDSTLTIISDELMDMEEDYDYIFESQNIQDQRLYNLEEDLDALNENLQLSMQDLENNCLSMESRISNLEVQGNSTSSLLSDLGERYTYLDSNAYDLEERFESSQEIIAFHAVLTDYTGVESEQQIVFNEAPINHGESYDVATGTFTVPEGGAGMYYLSLYLLVEFGEFAYFDIMVNNEESNEERVCTARGDLNSSGSDTSQATCSGLVYADEGDQFSVVYRAGSDTTPVWTYNNFYFNGFTAFKL